MGALSGLFDPARVAVIGATDREGSVGRAITANLLERFDGEVVLVNPNQETVMEQPCLDDIGEAEGVELAIVVVPPGAVVGVVEAVGKADIDNVVVITAGFSETGSEGAQRARELETVATEHDLNLVGPNSLGIMSTPKGLNATFGPEMAANGGVSFLSQSGAFITAALDWAADRDVGFNHIVSLGNKLVLNETDFIQEWGADPTTDVVIGYLESITDGRRFIDTAREVTRETPVVVIKSGRTEAGAQAASSHTGAIAGSDRAADAGLAQAGVLRADTAEELFDAARVLAGQPPPGGTDVAVVTNAGGPGVMTTDALGESRLSVASFTDETLTELEAALPSEANIYNPVDVLGDAGVERFRRALDAVLADPQVHAAVVVAAPVATVSFEDLAGVMGEVHDRHDTPVMACLMGGDRTRAARRELARHGIPNYFDPARAVDSLDTLVAYGEIRDRDYDEPMVFDVDQEAARRILTDAADREETRLGVEAMGLLDAYGIPTPPSEIVDDAADAEAVARQIDGDVVMKIVSPDILHKSDIGGVKVGVAPADAATAYEDLVTRAHNYQPDATVRGVQVQALIDTSTGTETILGMTRDPQFGPLLLFGLGGVFVEVLEDTTVRIAPVSEQEAQAMTREIDAAPLLRGARGRDPADLDAIVDAIGRLSQLVVDFPGILELDVNPLVAGPDGVSAVDIRLTIDPDTIS